MKKRIASLFLVLAMALTLLPTAVMAEESAPAYSGGTGTEENPWLISTVADLTTLADTVNNGTNYKGAYFKQTSDLDMTGVDWEPIGYTDNDKIYFAGNYNGDNHTISNITSNGKMDTYGQTTVGIFGCVMDDGSISNLHVRNANFTAMGEGAYAHAGGLVGIAFDATVTNCSVTDSKIESMATLNSNNCAGGISGFSISSVFSKCVSASNKINSQCYSGGIVGEIDDSYGSTNSNFVDCYVAKCSVTSSTTRSNGFSVAGGFIGEVTEDNPSLERCYVYDTTTSVEATAAGFNHIGVLVGNFYTNLPYQAKITTTDCYYGKCSTNENIGTAVEKSETEFTDGTVTDLLGSAFVQGASYPIINIPVSGVTLDKTKLSLTIGNEEMLTAAVLPAIALNQEVTWSSSDDTVATVDQTGKVTAIAAGTATITVTTSDGGKTATCGVTVSAPAPTPTPRPSRPSSPSYGVSTPATDNGTVSVSPKNASAGTTVTVTVEPDSGYVLGDLRVTDKNGDDVKLTDQGNGKYTFTMPAGGAEVSADFVKETKANPFTDVPSGAYYYDAVLWAAENGVTDGVTATLFAPDTACTRAQIVTFLWRAAGSPEPVGTGAFTDVPASAYYAKAVAWAVENGITDGTSETTFSPDAPCTRGQSMTFLYRARKGAANASTGFTDVPVGAYYAAPVAWAVENGITNGTGKTTFSPDVPCTRAEIVTFLYRAK